ncbi:uncharacterized protein LOC120270901 [Dioscorea cayenensis subsp. rotundata]|uniref:Uncharacterized protein LOC120270901 n=1 Tax=Dioscorea cayennensis subsp. rotundata TaxID=55577 RepID=A0AB40C2C9_DIOCR|nr:uncharacterized protein LOC120270901 [Dioscorea cayenensis subsp. rotundata]
MGRLPTTDFFFRMNLGPDNPCALCGFQRETLQHLFVSCPFIQEVWSLVSRRVNKSISFPDSFASGAWLTSYNYSHFVVSLIATCAWFHWKNRCDVIFRQQFRNGYSIVSKALAHVKDFFTCNHNLLGRKLICHNFSWAEGPFLFVYSHFHPDRVFLLFCK